MLIKIADNKSTDLMLLERLLTYPNLTDIQKKNIEQELRFLKAGLKTEADVQYLIDFDFKDSKNYAVIHDLRLEVNGRVAQIDHLLINRTLDTFVLETKSFHAGLKINDNGEFLKWNSYKKVFEDGFTYRAKPTPSKGATRGSNTIRSAKAFRVSFNA